MELKCAHQTYHWGRLGYESAVAQLVAAGRDDFTIAGDCTYAELWMGTHPSGPSVLVSSGQQLGLWIKQNPQSLGDKVLKKFGTQLPYLFKVLSVNKALSIQAHPTKAHAEQLHRSRPDLYKDDNHKPEMALALTPFEALCGFRPLEQIQAYLTAVPELVAAVGEEPVGRLLSADPTDPAAGRRLKECLLALLSRQPTEVAQHLDALVSRLRTQGDSKGSVVPSELILRLNGQYPGDVGIFCCLFLNHLMLQPGQALFLGPNEPHAYIFGDCVEIMACSDNVVRAGLTPKFKDVPTLVEMLSYECAPAQQKVFAPTATEGPGVLVFDPPVPDFTLAKIQFRPTVPDTKYTVPCRDSASLLLVVSGSGTSGATVVRRGTVLFVPANDTISLHLNSTEEVLMFQAFCQL